MSSMHFLPLFLLAPNPPESVHWHQQDSFPRCLGWQSFVLASSCFLVGNAVALLQQLIREASFHSVGSKAEGAINPVTFELMLDMQS